MSPPFHALPDSPGHAFRFRGVVAGFERLYLLAVGEGCVGSFPDCSVRLPVAGVSRRHALLRVTAAGVEVRDLGSKNGTRLGGQKVAGARVAAGDEVAFGPVRLVLEEVPAGDGLLALAFASEGAALEGAGEEFFAAEATVTLLPQRPGRPAAPGLTLRLPEGFAGTASPAMAAVLADLGQLAAASLPILLTGETGTGKELLARALHRTWQAAEGGRRRGALVALNCGALPADLLEAELFGIARGVATGVEARPGRLVEADGGTLFLDEVGDMPPALQVKLLRVLQEREVQPVGGAARRVDVRLVAATHHDLRRRVRAGAFREDLYYRLAGGVVAVPPLRQRREDLPDLLRHRVAAICRETGGAVAGITQRAFALLAAHPWPGNVRELEHVLRRAIARCPPGAPLDSPLVAAALDPAPGDSLPAGDPADLDLDLDLKSHLLRLEGELIRRALARSGGNRSRASRLLGIARNTLAAKLALHGIAGVQDADAEHPDPAERG